MSATVLRKNAKAASKSRVETVLRVSQGDRYVGDVLLDRRDRVWRRADTIPADVVLKAMLAYSRQGEVCGELVGRLDGRTYCWFVVGALAEESETVGEMLEVAA